MIAVPLLFGFKEVAFGTDMPSCLLLYPSKIQYFKFNNITLLENANSIRVMIDKHNILYRIISPSGAP